MSKIDVYKSGKQITLTDSDFIAAGGEGSVYKKNNEVFKIYLDQSKCILPSKVKELSVLNKNNIVSPKEMIFDNKNRPIGYVMDFINNTVPLMKVFSNSFRNRNKITDADSLKLVKNMMSDISYIHSCKILIVDGNEFNYLVDSKFYKNPYFIDVDSYQTKSFPATAIMPSIRDWESKSFSELTDWFSFAIVSTQIFLGIHPFKGLHDKFKINDFEARVKSKISIFNKEVKLPPIVRDFDVIPDDIRNWYIDLFEKGKRVYPPDGSTAKKTKQKTTAQVGSNALKITKLKEYESKIIGFDWINMLPVVYTEQYIYFDKDKKIKNECIKEGLIYSNQSGEYLSVNVENNNLRFNKTAPTSLTLSGNIGVDSYFISNNTIYTIGFEKLSEIAFTTLNKKLIYSASTSWNIMQNSSISYRGFVYSNILNRSFFYIPFSQNKVSILNIKELQGYRVIDGKYDNDVLVMLVYKNNEYSRWYFIFDKNHTSYEIVKEENILEYFPNFVCLDNGIVVNLSGEGTLKIFHKKYPMKIKEVINCGLPGDAILCKNGTEVCFYSGKTLYRLETK